MLESFYGFQPSWSPDGKWISFLDLDYKGSRIDLLRAVNIDSKQVVNLLRWGMFAKWSSDGKQLLCNSLGRLVLLDFRPYVDEDAMVLDEKEVANLEISPISVSGFNWFDWSADNRHVAVVSEGHQACILSVVDVATRQTTLLYQLDNPENYVSVLQRPSFSPDGRRIVCGGAHLIVADIDSGREEKLFPEAHHAVWSPKGNLIAFFVRPKSSYLKDKKPPALEHGIYIYDLDARKIAHYLPLNDIRQTPLPIVWSPDGQAIAYEATKFKLPWTREEVIFVYNLKDKKLTEVARGSQYFGSYIAWSNDSTYIAASLGSNGKTTIIKVA